MPAIMTPRPWTTLVPRITYRAAVPVVAVASGSRPDTTAPTVTLVLAPASRFSPAVVDVQDANSLALSGFVAEFPSGDYEVVHDGTGFAVRYAGSSVASIPGGHRYTLLRAGGWGARFTLRSLTVDAGGNRG